MNVTIAGCGRWGSFITWYLDRIGHQTTLYGRKSSKRMQAFLETRKNDLLELPPSVTLSTDLHSLCGAEVIVVSMGAQNFRGFLKELAPLELCGKIFVLCMKGIEDGSGKRLSEIAKEELDPSNRIAVWLGPGHVQEFYAGRPNCMVIDSESQQVKELLIEAFSSETIRFYYGEDMIGNELGAAAKNVIGIAAGILDGLGLSTLKGALMSRGTHEISLLIRKMGGNPFSAYGLCHLGDYEATVFSPHSHNRRFGEAFIRGEPYSELAEGYYTVKPIVMLAKRYGVAMPICECVCRLLYENADPQKEINLLFARRLKKEFET